MRYFSVNKEELSGMVKTGEVYSDNEYINGCGDVEARTITLGYSVWEYDENGMTDKVEFYRVATDMEDFTNNEELVLAKIKEDYSADKGWQNNNW